jgi:adenine phosphoribosyltransferase
MRSTEMPLADRIRTALVQYPDWPKPGVTFADLSPVYADAGLRRKLTAHFSTIVANEGADAIAAIESRGYLLGMSIAEDLGLPFVQIRKGGKLPGDCVKVAYSLEYGTAELEIQAKSFTDGDRVLIVDDVLATGGTASAARDLVSQAGGIPVGLVVIAEIPFLKGRDKLQDLRVDSLIEL